MEREDQTLARAMIAKFSEEDPCYAIAVEAIKDAMAYRLRMRDPEYGRERRVQCEDESRIEEAFCSLGMGTKMLPSNRYAGRYAERPRNQREAMSEELSPEVYWCGSPDSMGMNGYDVARYLNDGISVWPCGRTVDAKENTGTEWCECPVCERHREGLRQPHG